MLPADTDPAPRDPDGRSAADLAAAPARQLVAEEVLAVIDATGIPWCLRNGDLGALSARDDLDVLVARKDVPRLRGALTAANWHHVRARGHSGHEFWVHRVPGAGMLKLDLVWRQRYGRRSEPVEPIIERRCPVAGRWVASPEDQERHRAHRAAGLRHESTPWERAAQRVPLSWHRSGPVIAVLGPDGAGKGTIIEGVRRQLPIAATVTYLGERRFTRLDAAPPPPYDAPPPPHDVAGGEAQADPEPRVQLKSDLAIWELAHVVKKWTRFVLPLAQAHRRAWSGDIVLCDRHPLDVVAMAPPRPRLVAAAERALYLRVLPRPDVLVVLDAPGTVLFERKGEHSAVRLERWRQRYRSLPGAHIVDTTTGPEPATEAVFSLVWAALARRRRWSGEHLQES